MNRTEAYIHMLEGGKVTHLFYPNEVFLLNQVRRVISVCNTHHIQASFLTHPMLEDGWNAVPIMDANRTK